MMFIIDSPTCYHRQEMNQNDDPKSEAPISTSNILQTESSNIFLYI